MADYKGVITELKAKRAALQGEVAELNTVIGALEQMSHNAGPGREAQPYRGLRLKAAAQKALELARAPRGTKQLLTELETGGFTTKSTSPYRSLYRVLSRLSVHGGPVTKLKDGWAIREWHSRSSTPPVRRAA